ncbi:MAG: hypothetical protein H6Q67_1254 [Firmicutes bacterium]|nr:hypothetical protein [Bacillota bacterium]
MARELALEEKIQKALDIQAVQNVMSKHAYYHGLGLNIEELENIWSKTAPNVSFAQNSGYWVGYDSIYTYYGTDHTANEKASLARLKVNYPSLTDDDLGAGILIMHCLTTPIIEIAGDGQTAKGMWYTPGQITEIGGDGYPNAAWMWEKYGVDFIKEDGEWKIWHMQICTDCGCPVAGDTSWVTSATTSAAVPVANGVLKASETTTTSSPDIEVTMYNAYSNTQVPQNFPKMPEPYYTFSETFSYGPEWLLEKGTIED